MEVFSVILFALLGVSPPPSGPSQEMPSQLFCMDIQSTGCDRKDSESRIRCAFAPVFVKTICTPTPARVIEFDIAVTCEGKECFVDTAIIPASRSEIFHLAFNIASDVGEDVLVEVAKRAGRRVREKFPPLMTMPQV